MNGINLTMRRYERYTQTIVVLIANFCALNPSLFDDAPVAWHRVKKFHHNSEEHFGCEALLDSIQVCDSQGIDALIESAEDHTEVGALESAYQIYSLRWGKSKLKLPPVPNQATI
jgi:hypothetical protein